MIGHFIQDKNNEKGTKFEFYEVAVIQRKMLFCIYASLESSEFFSQSILEEGDMREDNPHGGLEFYTHYLGHRRFLLPLALPSHIGLDAGSLNLELRSSLTLVN